MRVPGTAQSSNTRRVLSPRIITQPHVYVRSRKRLIRFLAAPPLAIWYLDGRGGVDSTSANESAVTRPTHEGRAGSRSDSIPGNSP